MFMSNISHKKDASNTPKQSIFKKEKEIQAKINKPGDQINKVMISTLQNNFVLKITNKGGANCQFVAPNLDCFDHIPGEILYNLRMYGKPYPDPPKVQNQQR